MPIKPLHKQVRLKIENHSITLLLYPLSIVNLKAFQKQSNYMQENILNLCTIPLSCKFFNFKKQSIVLE